MPAPLDPREEQVRIPGSRPGLSLFLRCRHGPGPHRRASCCMCMARHSRPNCPLRTDADAAWLFGAFTASPIGRDVKISGART